MSGADCLCSVFLLPVCECRFLLCVGLMSIAALEMDTAALLVLGLARACASACCSQCVVLFQVDLSPTTLTKGK